MADNIAFRPVRGKDAKIQSAEYQEGYVYFATDTKKIYLDANGVRAPMGGNSGIYYGKKNFGEVDEGQTQFTFEASDLEINDEGTNITIPNVDDLILNIPDGCFYRVIEIIGSGENAIITAEQLTIAGSGGGSGGTGSLVGTYELRATSDKNVTILSGSDYSIKFYALAKDSNGDVTGNGTYELLINNLVVAKGTAYQGENSVAVGDYLQPNSDTTIVLKVYMDVGGSDLVSKRITFTITSTDMELEWKNEKNTNIHYLTDSFAITYSISGVGFSKSVTLVIDDIYEIPLMTDSETTREQTYYISSSDLIAYGIGHKAHKFELQGTANLNGQTITAEPITKNIIFVEEGNTNPIISMELFDTNLIQYNTIFIPVVIYSLENTSNNAIVTLRENGKIIDTWENVENCVEYTWSYTPTSAGTQILSIYCGLSEVQKTVEVEKLDIDNEEVPNYAFKFNANNFASNAAIQSWNDNGTTVSFSDKFDWVNGGLKFDSSENRSYVCVKAGSTMTINYPVFAQNAMTAGKCLKVIFKASMCRDYDAQVLKCVNANGNRGFIMNAQGSVFMSAGSTLEAQYCEDYYIELEFDITNRDRDNNDLRNYVKMWIDGVPCGFVTYKEADNFTITDGNDNIVIGSDECDVHICMIKLYEKTLTDDEHLQNFIADAPNATEMLARYNRNNILNERTKEIDPVKTALANPDLLVHVYEIDRMTTTKKDEVTGCKYYQYHNSESPVVSAENVTIKVQGTSSQMYVIAAANLDSKFNDGFIYSDGTTSNGWSMDGGEAIPVDYFCTKVNVASCENGNNAVNQEWYNLFQPYMTVLKAKNPSARDTMQFTNGVIFLKDNNKTYKVNDSASDDNKKNNVFGDTSGYIANPYNKFYSIGQMGNSKKNTTVFHDNTNPRECCIEVCDNQQPQQHMVSDVYEKSDCGEAETYFEFRYPDGVKNATDAMKQGWNDFVSWMAKSNPQPKYELVKINSEEEFDTIAENNSLYVLENEVYQEVKSYDSSYDEYYKLTSNIYGYDNLPLAEPETYEAYKFKGFIADITDEQGNNYQEQAGYEPLIKDFQDATYAGTYTHDTYERRMAKMLSECEDHLVMDSVVYHYLMIETHCMIDNVSKNTFWSSEDCQHWFLNKDYDNDTADGNDNEGKLTRTYGLEVMDKMADGSNVFNATNSVWVRFIDGLKKVQDYMYQEIEKQKKTYNGREVSAFSKDDYLWAFSEWQDRIPERCYIEDYYRKYFRPYEVFNSTMFSEMLMGGKKQYQRAAFETYQEIYMSSRHRGNAFTSSYITLRLNGSGLKGKGIPAKVYSDCYISLEVGQQTQDKRVKRTDTDISFIVPVNELGDATAALRPGKIITAIGSENKGFDELVPKTITLDSAPKLRELYLSDGKGTANAALTDITFKANPMLEILRVGGLTSYKGALDLSNCPNIKEVNGINSTFTDVIVADNAPLVSLKLQNPTSLTLANLYDLEELEVIDKSRLLTLRLNNIDSDKISSKQLVEETIAATKDSGETLRYRLNNVDWEIDDPTEVDDTYSKESIKILETLKNDCEVYVSESETASLPIGLTGNLSVTDKAYSGDNSIGIYNAYAKADVYPNLDISFEAEASKLYTIQIYSGSGELLWFRKLTAGTSFGEPNETDTFLSEGPNGAFTIDSIYKSNTSEFTYTFNNQWEVYKSLDRTDTPVVIDSQWPVANNVSTDLVFVPKFIEEKRSHQVRFFCEVKEDGNLNTVTPSFEATYEYGTSWDEIQPKTIPYKPTPDSYDLKKAWDFKGYSLLPNSSAIVADSYTVTGPQDFYAAFELIEDISKVIHEEWFDYISTTYSDSSSINLQMIEAMGGNEEDCYPSPAKKGIEGWAIKIKDGYTLKGKITIPAYYEGKPVVVLAEKFGINNPDITHVFMQTDKTNTVLNELYQIGNAAFYNDTNSTNSLKYFDFTTVRCISSQAFTRCANLDPELFSLGENLWLVDSQGFNGICTINKPVTFVLPSELRFVREYAFTNFGFKAAGANSTLQIGTANKPSKLCLEYYSSETKKFTQNLINNTYYPYSIFNIYSDKYTAVNQAIDDKQFIDYFIRQEEDEYQNEVTFNFNKKGEES